MARRQWRRAFAIDGYEDVSRRVARTSSTCKGLARRSRDPPPRPGWTQSHLRSELPPPDPGLPHRCDALWDFHAVEGEGGRGATRIRHIDAVGASLITSRTAGDGGASRRRPLFLVGPSIAPSKTIPARRPVACRTVARQAGSGGGARRPRRRDFRGPGTGRCRGGHSPRRCRLRG
jgi:hypothetical protein